MQRPDLCALQAGARRAGCSPRPFAAPPAPLRPAARPARPGPHPPAWRGAARLPAPGAEEGAGAALSSAQRPRSPGRLCRVRAARPRSGSFGALSFGSLLRVFGGSSMRS